MIRLVVFDLDGVVRHFDPGHVADIERRHSIALGSIEAVAFAQPLLGAVTTGRISRRRWVETVGDAVGNAAAAAEWGRQPFSVDALTIRISEELRDLGVLTAILTNGTDTVPAELAGAGVTDKFDAIFNSAEIGHAKPDARAYLRVLEEFGIAPRDAFFTDDSPSKIVGAGAVGMVTHLYTTPDRLRTALRECGLGVSPG